MDSGTTKLITHICQSREMEKMSHNTLSELLKALTNRDSALGTYFRAISKEAIKDLFRNESSQFLEQGITELVHLEDYEICAAFQELLREREATVAQVAE